MKVKCLLSSGLSIVLVTACLQVIPQTSFAAAIAENSNSVAVGNVRSKRVASATVEPLGYWSSLAPTYLTAGLTTAVIAPATAAWPSISAGKCLYEQPSDWPHISNNVDASVHGWWTTGTKTTCPATALVTAYLQASWCGWLGCSWVTVAVGPGLVVYPGGGAGFRDNARIRCADRVTPVAFRGGTDVDLVGVNDPSGITWGSPRDGVNALLCAPS